MINSQQTHPDLTELHLNLPRHPIRPVLLPEEVPRDPANQSVQPAHRHLLFFFYWAAWQLIHRQRPESINVSECIVYESLNERHI